MKNRATILCSKDGRILLVTRGRGRWTLPGGTIKRKELALQAAQREIYEETTIFTSGSAGSMSYLFAFGGLNKLHHVFVFDLPACAVPRPANEIVRCCWIQPSRIAAVTTSVPTREIVNLFYTQLRKRRVTTV